MWGGTNSLRSREDLQQFNSTRRRIDRPTCWACKLLDIDTFLAIYKAKRSFFPSGG